MASGWNFRLSSWESKVPSKFAPEEFASSPFALSIFPGQAFGGECNRKQPTFWSLLKCNLIGMNLTLANSLNTDGAWKPWPTSMEIGCFGWPTQQSKNKVWSRIFMHLAVEIHLDWQNQTPNWIKCSSISSFFYCFPARTCDHLLRSSFFLQETAFSAADENFCENTALRWGLR